MSRLSVQNFDYSLSINGTSGYVDLGNNFDKDGSEAFSVSAWIYLRESGRGTHRSIIRKQDSTSNSAGWIFKIENNDELNFLLINDVSPARLIRTDSIRTMPHNQFIHVTATYDGSKQAAGVTMYLSGAVIDYTDVYDSLTGYSSANSANCSIGYRASDSGQIMDGLISRVRTYNKKLTSAEVGHLYRTGIAPDVEAEWLMTDGSGTTLTASVGGVDGTITTPVWSSVVPMKERSVISVPRISI